MLFNLVRVMASQKIKAKPAKAVTSILLPFCEELQRDIFVEVIKSVVWHSKMDDDHIDAMKTGMTMKTVCVKSNDLCVEWTELTSESQQLRQYQLLGFWAASNFPAFCIKLIGDSWTAPQRQAVEIVGSEPMPCDAVDTVIMQKMKLRSIELKISSDTMSKLRHFVKTPKNIGTYNEIRISSTMTTFTINEVDVDKCWEQLKHGNPSMSEVRSIGISL